MHKHQSVKEGGLLLFTLFLSGLASATDYYSRNADDGYQHSSLSGTASSAGWATSIGGGRAVSGMTAGNRYFICSQSSARVIRTPTTSWSMPAGASLTVQENCYQLLAVCATGGTMTFGDFTLEQGAICDLQSSAVGTVTIDGTFKTADGSALQLRCLNQSDVRQLIFAGTLTGGGALNAYIGTAGSSFPQTVNQQVTGDLSGFTGDIAVWGNGNAASGAKYSLELVNANSIPADPSTGTSSVAISNSATLKVDQDWTSGANRSWNFGSSGKPTVYVAEGKTLRINGTVTGTIGLKKTGGGTLVFTPPGKSQSVTVTGDYEFDENWTITETDTVYLQRLLREGAGGAVTFPARAEPYVVTQPLVIRSGTTLTCESGVALKLANQVNNPILVNEHHASGLDRDITVIGGTWDGNNVNQTRASYTIPVENHQALYGMRYGQLIVLSGVTNLTLRGMTVKDPQGFAIQLTDTEDFLVEDIVFNCNDQTANEDGLHVNGYAHRGIIRRISGHTNDDLIALNSDEGEHRSLEDNDITDVLIEDVNGGDNGYTGVRLLSRNACVSNVTIRNVSGQFKHFIVSFTHWAKTGYVSGMGHFHDITLTNITATSALTAGVSEGSGLIWFQQGVSDVGTVRIQDSHRVETSGKKNSMSYIRVDSGVFIDKLILTDVTQTVYNSQKLLDNAGSISTLLIDEDEPMPGPASVIDKGKIVTRLGQTAQTTLKDALLQFSTEHKNPVVTELGSWTFKSSAGTVLTYGTFTTGSYSGLSGACGAGTARPYVMVNTASQTITLNNGLEGTAAPGETYLHPGNDNDSNILIEFEPAADMRLKASGGVRSVHTSWGANADGVLFSGTLNSSTALFESLTTTSDDALHTFETGWMDLGSNDRIAFTLDRRSAYNYDGTRLDIAIERAVTAKPVKYREVSISTNVNALVAAGGAYPDEPEVNGVKVRFGKTTALDGSFTTIGRQTYSEGLVGWANHVVEGTHNAYPFAYANVSGGDAAHSASTKYPAHADEWILHPNGGVYSAIRFTVGANFRKADSFLIFSLRDLLPMTGIANKGEEIFVFTNGVQAATGLLDKGKTLTLEVPLPALKAGDVIEYVQRSRYNGGANIQADLTALSVTLQTRLPKGFVVTFCGQ